MTYKIYNEEMRNRFGLNRASYIKGFQEGCRFELYLKGKPSRNWIKSYNLILKSCEDAKLFFGKSYTIDVMLIMNFNKIVKCGDRSVVI